MQGILGLIVIIMLAWLISENRRKFPFKVVIVGLALQFAIAIVMLKVPMFKDFFVMLNKLVDVIDKATTAGTSFVFGYLGGAPLPFEEKSPGAAFIFAFKSLPLMLIISALSSLLFYWKILPIVVRAFSFCLQKTMKIGGAVGVGAAANVFLGMIEAPLIIRPYLERLTRTELFTTMTCGMANVAGTVMVLYASILSGRIPDAMGHILAASIISTPAAILISLVMFPETGHVTTGEEYLPQSASSTMDAISKGTSEGVSLLINVIAMLVVLVALVSLANTCLELLPPINGKPVTLQGIFGFLMAPVTWLIGIPWSEAGTAGALFGTKTVLNEFIAYLDMSALPQEALSPKSRLIMLYALCGFANFGSLGILIGGLGSMAPSRRDEIVSLGWKTMISGTMSTCMSGSIIGIIS